MAPRSTAARCLPWIPATETIAARAPAWLIAALRRVVQPGRQRRLLTDTLVLGLGGVAAAQVFNALLAVARRILLFGISGYAPPGLPSENGNPHAVVGPQGLWLVPLATTLGGLLVGGITEWLAPEAEGHGTDAVVHAFHRTGGALRGRVAPVKVLASAITIGSGGAAGREGPIALVAASLGSTYARVTGRGESERRLLMLTGAAAGLSAIFRSPIGAAFFVVEVLYADMEFESSALLYATLGAIVAYAVNGMIVGWSALFVVPSFTALATPLGYGWYALLGVAAGLIGVALPVVFYRTRDMFRRLQIRPYARPAIGGLLTGGVILLFPEVMAGGYGWIQRAIDGAIPLQTMAALVFAQMLALSFTVGSGGSGGVFAPSLFVGAMLGGVVAAAAHQPSAPFVVVGMAAVFAGAAHVPIATMMMVTEMTGGYTLLVPAALAVVLSYLTQTRMAKRFAYRSIYEAQVATRGDSPAHDVRHLTIALELLRQERVKPIENAGELDLVSLLQSGLAVDLGDDRRLFAGALRSTSPFAHTTLAESGRMLGGPDTNVIAISRGNEMLAPRADTVLEPGDRLILVASANAVESLRGQLAPWHEPVAS